MRRVSLLAMLIFVVGCSEVTNELKVIVDNNAGVMDLYRERDQEALQRFAAAVARDPFHPQLQMNLGVAYEVLEDFDKAYQSYNLVLEAENLKADVEFQALFNLARVEGHRQNIKEALELYQRALKLNPKSQEVKHNIELLLAGEGSGQGDGEDDSEGGEGSSEGEDNEQPDNSDQQQEEEKEQPQPEELRPEDVEQILEELSRQEKRIRAKEMEQQSGEAKDGKNW